MVQTSPLFGLFSFFSQDKCSTNFTNNDKSVDGLLGTWTQGGRIVGADKSTELWWHPLLLKCYILLFIFSISANWNTFWCWLQQQTESFVATELKSGISLFRFYRTYVRSPINKVSRNGKRDSLLPLDHHGKDEGNSCSSGRCGGGSSCPTTAGKLSWCPIVEMYQDNWSCIERSEITHLLDIRKFHCTSDQLWKCTYTISM